QIPLVAFLGVRDNRLSPGSVIFVNGLKTFFCLFAVAALWPKPQVLGYSVTGVGPISALPLSIVLIYFPDLISGISLVFAFRKKRQIALVGLNRILFNSFSPDSLRGSNFLQSGHRLPPMNSLGESRNVQF